MAGHRDLRHHHDFTLLWVGQTASELGTQVGMFAVPLVAFALTGSVFAAGVAEAADLAGLALVLLPAGVWADRCDRRRLMRVSSGVAALAFAVLVVAAAAGALTYPLLVGAVFVAGCCQGVFLPAETSAVRTVVEPALLPVAISQNQARQHVASVVGGPLGGLLYGLARSVPFAFDAVSYAVSWAMLGRLRADLSAPADLERRSPLRQVREGWAWCWSRPFFRTCLIWSPLANLVINAVFTVAILRLVADGTAPLAIGLVSTAAGLAGVLGAVIAPWLIERIPTGRLTVLVAWSFTPLLVPLVFLDNPWVVGAALAVGLLLNPAGNAGVGSYRVAMTPLALQGRVTSSMQLASYATMPFAAALGGALLSVLGGALSMAVLAAACGAVALVPTCSRAVRSVPRPEQWLLPEPVEPTRIPATR